MRLLHLLIIDQPLNKHEFLLFLELRPYIIAMGWNLSGAIDYTEQFENGNSWTSCYCLLPDLGNDSLLIRILREHGQPLIPDHGEPLSRELSWDTIDALTTSVACKEEETDYSATLSFESAQRMAEQHSVEWFKRVDNRLLLTEKPSELISEQIRLARVLDLPGLEAVQRQYQEENLDDYGEVITIKVGEKMPHSDKLLAFAGVDDNGDPSFRVEMETGPPSYWLSRVLKVMKTAIAEHPDLRFIYWLT